MDFWDRLDLDHILTESDSLYKTLNTFDMLSVDDLPCFVRVYGENVQIEFLQLETKLETLTYVDPFLRNIVSNTENVLILLFMGGYKTAVISSQNFFYVFDSHSGDERRLSIANGRSVLLKFRYVFEIEKYIQVAYLEYRDQQQLHFQAHFIKIKTEAIEVMSICSKYKKSVKRNYNQQFYRKNSPSNSKRKRQIYSEKFGTPPHDKLKANMRLCNDQVHVRDEVDQVEATTHQYAKIKSKRKVRKLFHDINMPALIVLDFKNQIKEGPLYICVICNRCLYKILVTLFKKENYNDVNAILTS